MTDSPIEIRFGDGTSASAFTYCVANCVALRADRRMTWLQSYTGHNSDSATPAKPPIRLDLTHPRTARGILADATREVRLQPDPGGLRMEISGAGEYRIDAAAQSIEYQGPHSAGTDLIEEALLGPPLLTALAARGLWAIHASAVQTPNGVVLIAGESGSGKSTLASRLKGRHADLVTRLADDLIHLRAGQGNIIAAPAYPQLRLPPHTQSPGPDSVVESVIVLEPAPDKAAPTARALRGREKLQALLANTVAARAFPPALAAAHLEASREMGARLAMHHVLYPHTADSLARVAEWVAEGARTGRL